MPLPSLAVAIARRAAVFAFLVLAACGFDSGSSADPHAERGPLGKGDDLGSCVGACGAKSDASCWCDELCVGYGDCCSDVETVCWQADGGVADAGSPDADLPALGDRAFFYGNAGTWGWLGLSDTAGLLHSPAQVSARYAELCADARAIHPDGDALPCHADLIAVTPAGDISKTQAVAETLIAEHGATISIDLRTRGDLSFDGVRNKVDAIFRGDTNIVSAAFLEDHLVGLSLDLEPQVVDSGWRPSAAQVNAMCTAYRDRMIGYGHDPDELYCFLYEFGHPTMVLDGENLDPWIFPILMSGATRPRVVSELSALGLPVTPENLREVGLDIKEAWVVEVDAEYANTETMGCMLFTAPYLHDSQRDMFSFADAIDRFDDRCHIWSFQ